MKSKLLPGLPGALSDMCFSIKALRTGMQESTEQENYKQADRV